MQQLSTKEIIYQKAQRMFSDRGYSATTIRDIADEVGIKVASLYAHVSGKEELLWELVHQAAEAFYARVNPIIDSSLAPEEKLRAAIIAHVEVIAENIESATIYFHEWKFLSPKRKRALRDRRDAYEALFRDIINEGMRKKVFFKRDARYVSILLLSSLNGIYTWYRKGGVLKPAQLGTMYADLLITGLK